MENLVTAGSSKFRPSSSAAVLVELLPPIDWVKKALKPLYWNEDDGGPLGRVKTPSAPTKSLMAVPAGWLTKHRSSNQWRSRKRLEWSRPWTRTASLSGLPAALAVDLLFTTAFYCSPLKRTLNAPSPRTWATTKWIRSTTRGWSNLWKLVQFPTTFSIVRTTKMLGWQMLWFRRLACLRVEST